MSTTTVDQQRLIREAIRDFEQIAQMVHNAYHVERPSRISWQTWRECGMASCERTRAAIAALEPGVRDE